MEGSKDIQRTDSFGELLDGQIIRTSPFGRSSSGERAYRRTERLVAALHMLTNHIPIQEPARVEARKVGVKLLSEILALRDEMRVSSSPSFRAAQASIRELISLIRVLSISGFISLQNTKVIVEALDELGNFLMVSQRSVLSESVTFSKDELLGTEDTGLRSTPSRETPPASRVAQDAVRKSIKDKRNIKDTPRVTDKTHDMGQVLDRRGEAVLGVLRAQGTVGIKDIAVSLPEYSEKMIQRELFRLTSLERVKKVGFKRWSKYELVR